MRKAYWRCNSGHYYSSLYCPVDGWTFEGCAELIAAEERATVKNAVLTIRTLVLEGAPERAIKRTIIIEFGSDEALFDAILPEGYVIGGDLKTTRQLDHEHL